MNSATSEVKAASSSTTGTAAAAAKCNNHHQSVGGGGGEGGGGDVEKVAAPSAAEEEKDGTWRCPDPGCKKSNPKNSDSCTQCTLPRHSAHQFKRGHHQGRKWGQGHGGGGNRHRHQKGGGGYQKTTATHQQKKQPKLPAGIDPENPVVAMFAQHAKELDEKHDRHERIVKLSRDITIESKKVIFTLHRITREDDKPTVLQEAESKLAFIRRIWRQIAVELKGRDPYQFLRGYTAGLQEYIEALSFYHYICFDKLISVKQVCDDLLFEFRTTVKEKVDSDVVEPTQQQQQQSRQQQQKQEQDEEVEEEEGNVQKEGGKKTDDDDRDEKEDISEKTEPIVADVTKPIVVVVEKKEPLPVLVPALDFLLGLADLTGELMRQAINLVGSGETEVCFQLLQFLHQIHAGFLRSETASISRQGRLTGRKIAVLEQSLKKVENACYAINVRGTEVPKDSLVDFFKQSESTPIEYCDQVTIEV